MYIQGRFKLIRKHDCDFWNLTYYRISQNRFFNYFKFSLIHRVKDFTRKKEIRLVARRTIKITSLSGYSKARRYFSPFLNKGISDLLDVKKNINFYKLFLRRGLRFVTYIYRRCFYYRHAFANDLLLGVKSSYRIYKPFRQNMFQKTKLFFKQITLFYNSFDYIKLKRFGRLGRSGQSAGINNFFYLLESRVDSIILRLNLGCKFILREVIKSNKILVENNLISYPNLVVRKNFFVSFIQDFKALVYITLLHKVKIKMFYSQPPIYLEINYRTLKILLIPSLMDPSFVPYPFIRSKSSLIAGLHTVLWGW